jgi:hypothetical protein
LYSGSVSSYRKFLIISVAISFIFPVVSAGTLDTYRDVVEGSVHELYADEISEDTYELKADAYGDYKERDAIYAAYITDYSPSEYRNFSFYLEEQSNVNHNFHLTTYWLQTGSLSDIGTGDYEQLKDFNQPPAGTDYTTDLTDRNEEYGKVAVVVEGTHYWLEDDYLRVVVSNISAPDTGIPICDSRGPLNECISNEEHNIDGQAFDITSVFESRFSSTFESLNSQASINVSNSTRLSGLWRGSFHIMAERPVVENGARFRPEGGEIIIGD